MIHPLRGSSIDIHPNARWQQNGITVAGGSGRGNGSNQLSSPSGLYVDDDQTIYVADQANHRIVEWKQGATNGQVVADGNGQGSGDHQLYNPYDVIIDKERDSLIICDYTNKRVVRWPRRNVTSGEKIISNITCVGLTMDENGSLYITDYGKNEVRRYRRGESEGTVVAGGNGYGNRLDQLSSPTYVFVDRDHSVYVSDRLNHRVMKWMESAKQGIVVAGGQGGGNDLTQLLIPEGVVVDQLGTVYVADHLNYRIMRWPKGATQGSVIVGGNGSGEQSNQLNRPIGYGNGVTQLSYPQGVVVDQLGTVYVADRGNDRIMRWPKGATQGSVIVDGNGSGGQSNQFNVPSDIDSFELDIIARNFIHLRDIDLLLEDPPIVIDSLVLRMTSLWKDKNLRSFCIKGLLTDEASKNPRQWLINHSHLRQEDSFAVD
ncbi:unnamed protein product [Rotaria sp. Silwood1]|nr:unnamed protein product [Rotaria sp. Silwood1]